MTIPHPSPDVPQGTSPPPPASLALSAADILAKEFLVVSRGFDQDEVRHFLSRVALVFKEQESELDILRSKADRLSRGLQEATHQLDASASQQESLREANRGLVRRLEVAEAVRADALRRTDEASMAAISAQAELRAVRLVRETIEAGQPRGVPAEPEEPDPERTMQEAHRALQVVREQTLQWERRAADARRRLDALADWIGSAPGPADPTDPSQRTATDQPEPS